MRSLALANQKGGVGKTTTTVHLAHGLALAGKQVVIFDLDPQGNATLAVQEMAMSADESSEFAPLVAAGEGLWLLPSAGAERSIGPDEQIDFRQLEGLVEQIAPSMDVLLVDCPPRMDSWGWAGLRLCEHVLVPVQAEFFAMHGLTRMMDTMHRAQAERRGRGELMGVFVTMFDHREEVALEVRADLQRNLGSTMFESVVVRDSQFIEAASHGVTLFEYNPFAKGARCYAGLVREVLAFWDRST